MQNRVDVQPNNANKKKKGQVINLLEKILYNSFFQAILRSILTPYLILKLFLIVCVLGSSGLASYLVIQSIMSYFTYEVASISRTIYENPAKFPKVTFCNINWFTTEYAFNLTQTDVKWATIKNFSDEQKKLLGHELEDILIECYFNFKPCNSTDFTWYFDEEYGNCYAFNAEANAKGMSISGSEFGLQLMLYVNIYEELLNDTNGNE
jgi:hypothetical protein